jgi:hypothetical protein
MNKSVLQSNSLYLLADSTAQWRIKEAALLITTA